MSNYHTRWMHPNDLKQVLEIEQLAFPEFPWTAEEIATELKRSPNVGVVVETEYAEILAFAFYELRPHRLYMLNFAVHPCCWRRGIGRALMRAIIDKLTLKDQHILLDVRESNLAAQLFFKSLGFQFLSILREAYEDNDEDAFVMQYRLPVGSRQFVRG